MGIAASLPLIKGKAEHCWRLAFLALVLAMLALLGACSEAPDNSTGQPGEGSPPSPLLFEIARADGAVHGWMLGTIHALPAGTQWRTPAIDGAVAAADVLILEVAALDDAKAMAETFRSLSVTRGLPLLSDRVAGEHRAQLEELTSKARLSPSQQRQTESWAAGLILARVTSDGDPASGVDRALLKDFAGRPVRELEGVKAQLGIFDRLPEADQRALLTAVITASDRSGGEADALRAAWLAGDAAALEAATHRGLLAHPPLRKALYIERNQRWMTAIEAALQGPQRPLIAVGAAHLVGPEGLVALLEERGWRLTRLT
jgi:uncharacterized protein